MPIENGVVFLSHASEDKFFVEEVYKRLDASLTFYDIKTIDPGQKSIEAMKRGVSDSAVFVLFHSPNSSKAWVEFEKELAETAKINTNSFQVLVCPIGGETHHSLPEWMKSYMTTTEDYGVSDIVRAILYLQRKVLDKQGYSSPSLIGREELLRKIAVDIRKAVAIRGKAIQQIVVAGLPGIGRNAVAHGICENVLPGMRPAGPRIELPDMAEAVDLFLRLREDIDGPMGKDEISRQMVAFQNLTLAEQASTILTYLLHFEKLNQPVVVGTRWGLRDRAKQLKPWFRELLHQWEKYPALKVIFVSERRLAEEEISKYPSLVQYTIERLSDDDIEYILNIFIEPRLFDASQAEEISRKILGHPATAKHVSALVNAGRSFDSLNSNPDPIHSFQDSALEALFAQNFITETQRKILALLGWFPRLPIKIITKVIPGLQKEEVSEELWQLLDYSLISSSDGGYYRLPDMVSSRVKRDPSMRHPETFRRVKEIIEQEIEGGTLQTELIDALLISTVETTGELPEELRDIVTSSSLLTLVQELFFAARGGVGSQRDVYQKIYVLSKLAMNMDTSDDAVEQILFTGGDSAIRSGEYPKDILDFMEKKGMASIYYLKGSYYFYIDRDFKNAAYNLRKAFELRHFRMRNARLLAKCLVRDQEFGKALDILEKLDQTRLMSDAGLVVLKIRALRGLWRHSEADALENSWKPDSDDYGEASLFNAGKALQLGNIPEARRHIEVARKAPKINRLSLQLTDCAVSIEEGDLSLLPETVVMANGAGRSFDSLQLQAKAAVKEGDWKTALNYIDQIDRKQLFDLHTESEALNLKLKDPVIFRDPAEVSEVRKRLDEVVALSARAPQGFRDA